MLIWINGAHGAGKTTVARQIGSLRPGAHIIDPEQVGFMLRRVLPGGGPDDFTDLAIWREMTASLLAAAAGAPHRLLVVPMTVTVPTYLDEILTPLRNNGISVRHFTLAATPDTLRRRLRWRIDWPSSRRWALSRVEESVSALADERFAMHVPSDKTSPSALAARILRHGGA